MTNHIGYEIAANLIEGGFSAGSGALAARLLVYPGGVYGGVVCAASGWLASKPIHYVVKYFFNDNGFWPTIITRICQFTVNFFANVGFFMLTAQWHRFSPTLLAAASFSGTALLFQGLCIFTVSLIATMTIQLPQQ